MKEYLEQALHRHVEINAFTAANLPLIYRSVVRLHELSIDGQKCILIEPIESMPLTELRKCYHQAIKVTGRPCALYLRSLTYYAKDALLKEGVPFVWEGRQLYLPFLGMILNSQDNRQLQPCEQLSFAAQKMLLTALYEGWQNITVSQAAEIMHVSKMTATRCFDEIEVLELPLLKLKNRSRRLHIDSDKHAIWNVIRPALRNPIIRTFRLAEAVHSELPKSGFSALAAYTMLEDNPYPTAAFVKSQVRELGVRAWKQLPPIEEPIFVAHEVGYILPFSNHNAVDPLSVLLMMNEENMADPRVELAVNEMLEEYVW